MIAAEAEQKSLALQAGAAESGEESFCRMLLHSWALAVLVCGICTVKCGQLRAGAARLAHSGSAAGPVTAQDTAASGLRYLQPQLLLAVTAAACCKIAPHACSPG